MISDCSCLRMELFRIPCVHLINVMVYLDLDKLPNCSVLRRWTIKAKEGLTINNVDKSPFRDSCYVTQVVSMNDNF